MFGCKAAVKDASLFFDERNEAGGHYGQTLITSFRGLYTEQPHPSKSHYTNYIFSGTSIPSNPIPLFITLPVSVDNNRRKSLKALFFSFITG